MKLYFIIMFMRNSCFYLHLLHGDKQVLFCREFSFLPDISYVFKTVVVAIVANQFAGHWLNNPAKHLINLGTRLIIGKNCFYRFH